MRVAPTPACTPGARSSASTRPPPTSTSTSWPGRSTSCCGPAIVVRDAPRSADDFDARFSARVARYRYTVLNRPVPDPFLAATVVARRAAARPAGSCAWPATRSSASTTSRRSAGAPKRGAGEPPASLVRRVRRGPLGRPRRRACCGSRSRPTPSATRWCAASSARSSRSGSAGRRRRSSRPSCRPRDRQAAGQLAPPAGAVPLRGGVLSRLGLRRPVVSCTRQLARRRLAGLREPIRVGGPHGYWQLRAPRGRPPSRRRRPAPGGPVDHGGARGRRLVRPAGRGHLRRRPGRRCSPTTATRRRSTSP